MRFQIVPVLGGVDSLRGVARALRELEDPADTEDAHVAAVAYPLAVNRGEQVAWGGATWRVGYAFAESTRLHEYAVTLLRGLDQVWVPSTFSQRVMAESGLAAHVVPHGLDGLLGRAYPHALARPALASLTAEERPKLGWVYSHSFDRKGGQHVLDLMAALDPRVLLVVKTQPSQAVMLAGAFEGAGISPDRVRLIAKPFTPTEMATWYTLLDALVYPTRGGSFELIPLEAIASGVPTIVTAAGAPLDYATDRNAYLVPAPGRSPLFAPVYQPNTLHPGDGFDVDREAFATIVRRVLADPIAARRMLPDLGAPTLVRWTWDAALAKAREAATLLGRRPALAGRAARRVVYGSAKERCGVAEYGRELSAHLQPLWPHETRGLPELTTAPLDFREGDVVLIHYEPGLVGAATVQALRRMRAQGARVVAVCHFYASQIDAILRGAVDAFVLHRPYVASPTSAPATVIPHGCFVYAPPPKAVLRARYHIPPKAVVLTTAGFLAPWKRTPAAVQAILDATPGYVLVQVIAPLGFTEEGRSEMAALRAVTPSSRVLLVEDFQSRDDLLGRIAASDLGFIYHGVETGSVSGVTKQFVSARCPLVTTSSGHATDLDQGVRRSPGLHLEPFADAVGRLAVDPGARATLAADMHREYERLRMDRIAERFATLLREDA